MPPPLAGPGSGDGHDPDQSRASQPRPAPEGPRPPACPPERHHGAGHAPAGSSSRRHPGVAARRHRQNHRSSHPSPLTSTVTHSLNNCLTAARRALCWALGKRRGVLRASPCRVHSARLLTAAFQAFCELSFKLRFSACRVATTLNPFDAQVCFKAPGFDL